jgi:hypothetical protein
MRHVQVADLFDRMANMLWQKIGDLTTECLVAKNETTHEIFAFVLDQKKTFIRH